MRKINKKNLKSFVIISLVCILLLSTILNINAGIGSKPDFDIELSATPTQALVGEDIIVNGVIKPKPFEAEVPAKEIVLVLDVSGSMGDKINVKCENERIQKYCTSHDKNEVDDKNNGWHNWKYDYCVQHSKTGEHTYKSTSTKISELKSACNKFIDTMKDVENLKIGIVTYSTSAEIKKIGSGSSQRALIPANQVSDLKGIINGLNASGGTNTGEGLRRAVYLLDSSKESNQNANKTVVLMSDGIPTYYTQKNSNYYTDTTIESPSGISTGGIGNIIKNKG